MSVESAADRRRKRIVEHTITGFINAAAAITFGNTLQSVVTAKLGNQKYRQYIGAPNTPLAITPEWIGPTVLRTTFLELINDDMAAFICDEVKRTTQLYNEVHRASLSIADKTVRGKPQPQFIGWQNG